jgi:MinD-like ATPase involved in chromosome partitioning or flagellar assembly
VSDHPTQGANAGVSHGREDRPTSELRPQPPPLSADEPPTRAFAGFRTERRFSEAVTRGVPPPETRVEPRAWAATPHKGLPRVVDSRSQSYGGGYYGGQPPAAQANTGYRQAAVHPSPYPELSTSTLLRQVKPPPSEGWRRWLYRLSGQLINVGESPRTMRYNDLIVQVNRPLRGCYRIAMLSLKGGVGKTTITATLGATFASIRGDRVVAVDANPDRGTLSQKVLLETPATVRHLLRDAEGIERYSDVRSYTSQGPSRLEVLASETDPAMSEAFSADDYTQTLELLERFYGLVLTDCGTGLLHSAMTSVLAKADALIVVSSGSIDGARSAAATLDWLDAHGHEDLVRNSIAVINAVRPRSGKVDMQKVVDHFSRRCRAVRLVPFDPHLEEGAEISLDRLKRETREALVELAAVVTDGFPSDQRRSNEHFI